MMDSGGDYSTLEARIPVHGGIRNLPDEMIVEILARLPVKSLLRFRCVSKSWLSLISSHRFHKSHLNISKKDRNLSNYRIMLTISNNPTSVIKNCQLSSLIYEPSTDAFDIYYPNKHRGYQFVLGSCNGLICLILNSKDLFFWNPSTRKSKKLPPANLGKQRWYGVYGFCYNESDDDYKVVGIFSEDKVVGVRESIVKIYSLKANSWKRLEDLKGDVLDDSSTFASGKLHWLVSDSGLDFEWDIVSLDMESDMYGIVEKPNFRDRECSSTLGVLGEDICVLCSYQISADVWVLKEYGVKESWTKVATVPYVDASGDRYSKTLFLLRNGEILLIIGMHFVVYNPKDNSLRVRDIGNLNTSMEEDDEEIYGADVYIESLVSPIANGR